MNAQTPTSILGRGSDLDSVTFLAGALASIGLHGLIIALVVIGTMHSEERIEEHIEEKMLEFEQVDLLALGEEKPPDALPRISNPAPPKVAPKKINLAPPTEPTVDLEPKKDEEPPKEAVEDEEKQKRRSKMLDALSALNDPERPSNEDLPEGDEAGVVGGNMSDAAQANLMGTYQAKLLGELSRNWSVPTTLSADEIKSLAGRVVMFVRLSPEGYVVTYNMKRSSGNEQYDAAIERLLQKFQVSGGRKKLPMPENEAIKALVLKQGLKLTDWEFTGK